MYTNQLHTSFRFTKLITRFAHSAPAVAISKHLYLLLQRGKRVKAAVVAVCLPFMLVAQANGDFPEPYDWASPAASFEMADELREISGLSIVPNSPYLYAIQDEDGILFLIDRQDGRIVQQIPFWKEGDYEGVEYVKGDVYVVKSTGTIYHIKAPGTAAQEVIKYNGFLGGDNDIEGLGYDAARNMLLLACKAEPGEDIDPNRFKAIYGFDIASKAFIAEPLLLLDRKAVDNYLSSCSPGPDHHKLCDIFSREKEDFDLSPAAMAVHPITKHYYMTSAKGNLLLIIDSSGSILHIDKLPKSLHRQPEGLCFDEQGNLYISNEQKKDNEAVIHFYTYNPNRP